MHQPQSDAYRCISRGYAGQAGAKSERDGRSHREEQADSSNDQVVARRAR